MFNIDKIIFFRFVYLEDCEHVIESEGLEQWMNQNSEEITLKQCPLCKTPILKTQRFMNQVKLILKDISVIKIKQFGELSVITGHKEKVMNSLKSLNNKFDLLFIGNIHTFKHIQNAWNKFYQPLLASLNFKRKNPRANLFLPAKDIESLEFVIHLFKSILKYKEQIEDIQDVQLKQSIINHFVWLLSVAFKYARQLSNQQKFDINIEMVRGARIISLFEIKSSSEYKMTVKMQTHISVEVRELVDKMENILMSCRIYNVYSDKEIQNLIELIKQKGILLITNKEKKMIHQAMSVSFYGGARSQGHWCKCQNGHIYCITECGGPMEKSFCPECKVEIGGINHAYVSGTSVASEIDGSLHLSWSEARNMENYI